MTWIMLTFRTRNKVRFTQSTPNKTFMSCTENLQTWIRQYIIWWHSKPQCDNKKYLVKMTDNLRCRLHLNFLVLRLISMYMSVDNYMGHRQSEAVSV